MWPFAKAKPVLKCTTPLGEARRIGHGKWTIGVKIGGADVQVFVKDVAGQPDPTFVRHVLGRMKFVLPLAGIAQKQIPTISRDHDLGIISQPEKGDLCLGFVTEYETIFVDFEGDQIVTWAIVD